MIKVGDPLPDGKLSEATEFDEAAGCPLNPKDISVAEATKGKKVSVHYTGWLTNGTKFDSSRDTAANGTPRTPIGFPLGARRVIAGWDAGFETMRVGSRRRLFIPYQLAYGEAGRPPTIPPRSALIFDIEVMAVADTLPREATPAPQGPPGPRCPAWTDVSHTAP